MSSIRRLLTPFSYLRIDRENKIQDEFFIPIILMILSVGGLALLSGKIPIFSEKGLLSFIVNYLQIVSGFYIASLAAVATFEKDSMDKPMPGLPTTLPRNMKGVEVKETLSRRRFLCFLFGYLSLLSMALYFAGSACILLAPSFKIILPIGVQFYFKWVTLCGYLFITYNLLITTLLGLYYMTDRIHRNDTIRLGNGGRGNNELGRIDLADDADD